MLTIFPEVQLVPKVFKRKIDHRLFKNLKALAQDTNTLARSSMRVRLGLTGQGYIGMIWLG
jgi:hypothetical protein